MGGAVDGQVMRTVNNVGAAAYQRGKLEGNEEGLWHSYNFSEFRNLLRIIIMLFLYVDVQY